MEKSTTCIQLTDIVTDHFVVTSILPILLHVFMAMKCMQLYLISKTKISTTSINFPNFRRGHLVFFEIIPEI